MRGTREGFVPACDGTKIFFRTEGDGFPLVVCNGILCSTGYWTYLRPFFRNRCRVVTWDYRGHGRSDPPRDPDKVTVECHARDLKSVLDVLEIPRAVLLGHSMGVQVILEFYRNHADRVLGLIPVLGTYGNPFRTFYGMQWPDKVVPALLRAGSRHATAVARFMKPLLRTELPIPLARMSGAIHWRDCPSEIMKDYFQHISNIDFEMGFRAVLAMARHTAEDVLETIRVPTLIVAGEKDPFTPPGVSLEMQRRIPGAEIVTIPGGTHTALVEYPLLLQRRMDAFMRHHFLALGYQPLPARGAPTAPGTAKAKRPRGRRSARKSRSTSPSLAAPAGTLQPESP